MNKHIFFLLLNILLVSCSFLERQGTNFDTPYYLKFTEAEKISEMEEGRFGFGYCTDGQFLYAINGSDKTRPVFYKDILSYNIENNKWSQLTDGLTPKRYCNAEYLNGNIFVFNGYFINGRRNDNIEIVNTETGEIKVISGNPNPLSRGFSAVWQGKIYIFGGGIYDLGERNQYSNAVWEFKPTSGEWTLISTMPQPRQVEGEIIDGVLYLIGGFMDIVSYRVEKYDIVNNSWKRLKDLDYKISANAIAKNGKFIWLIGSYHRYNLIAVFDTQIDKLYLVNSNIIGRKHAGAAIINNKLYVYGGIRNRNKRSIESVQIADLSIIEEQLKNDREDLKNK